MKTSKEILPTLWSFLCLFFSYICWLKSLARLIACLDSLGCSAFCDLMWKMRATRYFIFQEKLSAREETCIFLATRAEIYKSSLEI